MSPAPEKDSRPARAPGSLFVAILLSWVFPGLGHAYLGRRGRGVLYAVIVTGAFLLGLAYQGRLYTSDPAHPLTALAMLACYGAGILNIGARLILNNPNGNILASTFEYGCAFLLTAGMMNLLLMLDVYDIWAGAKD